MRQFLLALSLGCAAHTGTLSAAHPPLNDSSGQETAKNPTASGEWLPDNDVLYPAEIANPRQLCFSIGARFNDKVGGRWATPVSFGDHLPIYRWNNIKGGKLQVDLEAGVFAAFNMTEESFPLINADYYVGVPITYAKNKWSFRLRGYHISSHIGDDYWEQHCHLRRKNKSFEALDFSAAYQVTPTLRFFGTAGVIPLSDNEMHLSPFYIQYGAEARGPKRLFKQMEGQPFLAMFFQNVQDTNFAIDSTIAAGYEWGRQTGQQRKVRLFLEYHSGFSPEGQFSRHRTKYLALRLTYGF